MFSDIILKSFALVIGSLIVFSVYVILDFFKYLSWRKKALAAAATGEFIRTDISNKLISCLLVAVSLLGFTVFIAEMIITKDWKMLESAGVVAVALASESLFNKLKKKATSQRQRRKITFISILFYIVMIALYVFITGIIDGTIV